MFRSALVVTEDLAQLARWTDWLERAGVAVATCPGPAVRGRCPRMEAKPCPLREAVQIAVVGTRSIEGGRWTKRPERRCTRVPDDGTTVFVDEFGVQATVGGTLHRIGQATDWTLVSVASYLCHQPQVAGKGPDRT